MLTKILLKIAWLLFTPVRRRPIITANIQRILVIRLCCIGDVLFTTPLLRALKANYPRARISYLISPWCRELLAASKYVDEVIEFDAYRKEGWWRKLRRIRKALADVRAGRFDLALVLHRTSLSSLLPMLGRVRWRVGFNWESQGFSLTHPVPFRAEAHEVDRCLDCLEPLAAAPEGNYLELEPPPEAQEFAETFLAERGIRPSASPLIAIFPGGGMNPGTVMNTKRWTVAGYRELCRELAQRFNARLLFVGSREDAQVADAVLAGEPLEPAPIRAEGQTTLLQLAALLQHCDLFIGNDSGPLHIAAAVRTPTISIFGPTDPALLAPRGNQHRFVRQWVSCAPCYTPLNVHTAAANTCRLGSPVCMLEITAADVYAAACELLHAKGYQPR